MSFVEENMRGMRTAKETVPAPGFLGVSMVAALLLLHISSGPQENSETVISPEANCTN